MKYNKIASIAERYGISLIYLFGSQAEKGLRYLEEEVEPDYYSDLDIGIRLEDDSKRCFDVFGALYRNLSEVFDIFSVDIIFMNEVDSLFNYEIIKGINIYSINENTANEYEEAIMKKANDLSFHKETMHSEILEAIENGYFEFEYRPYH